MNTSHMMIVTPKGEKLIILSAAAFEDMRDALDAAKHEKTMAEIRSGAQETFSQDEVMDYLAEATPLAFWRKRRGLTQADLAEKIGVSQSYIASLEAGKRKGTPHHFLALAKALRVKMEDLVIESATV